MRTKFEVPKAAHDEKSQPARTRNKEASSPLAAFTPMGLPPGGAPPPVIQRRAEQAQQAFGRPAAAPSGDTGLSPQLQSGLEHLSGLSLNDVRVHYNSSKPAQIQAFAYAQGSNIYVGPGQQQHVAHEAWHVVQQKQGRVRSTFQAKGLAFNDQPELEQEADVMGDRAQKLAPFLRSSGTGTPPARRVQTPNSPNEGVIQGRWYEFVDRPQFKKQKVGDKVFEDAGPYIRIQALDNNEILRIKPMQPTIQVSGIVPQDEWVDKNIPQIPLMPRPDLDRDVMQLYDGHHRFVSALMHGKLIPVADERRDSAERRTDSNYWPAMTWLPAGDRQNSERAKLTSAKSTQAKADWFESRRLKRIETAKNLSKSDKSASKGNVLKSSPSVKNPHSITSTPSQIRQSVSNLSMDVLNIEDDAGPIATQDTTIDFEAAIDKGLAVKNRNQNQKSQKDPKDGDSEQKKKEKE